MVYYCCIFGYVSIVRFNGIEHFDRNKSRFGFEKLGSSEATREKNVSFIINWLRSLAGDDKVLGQMTQREMIDNQHI